MLKNMAEQNSLLAKILANAGIASSLYQGGRTLQSLSGIWVPIKIVRTTVVPLTHQSPVQCRQKQRFCARRHLSSLGGFHNGGQAIWSKKSYSYGSAIQCKIAGIVPALEKEQLFSLKITCSYFLWFPSYLGRRWKRKRTICECTTTG